VIAVKEFCSGYWVSMGQAFDHKFKKKKKKKKKKKESLSV